MAKEHILVVDDEEDIIELVEYNLLKNGFTVSRVSNGEDAIAAARTKKPDLLVLDLMLPGIDGLEVCRVLKRDAKTASIPILMLTAKGEESDVVTGLELGADDYVTKPFSPKILIARVKALLRRKDSAGESGEAVLRHYELLIDPSRHEVLVDDMPVELTHTEFRILQIMARRPGLVFTRDQIIDRVHGSDYAVTDRSVDVLIAGLRKKLGKSGKLIETVRGVGYRLKE